MGHSSVDNQIEEFIDTSVIYYIDDEIIDQTIQLRKTNKIKLPDAIVAATAIVHEFVLLIRNTADFKNMKKLKVENPWDWAK